MRKSDKFQISGKVMGVGNLYVWKNETALIVDLPSHGDMNAKLQS